MKNKDKIKIYVAYSWSQYYNYHWETRTVFDNSYSKMIIDTYLRNRCIHHAETEVKKLYKEFQKNSTNEPIYSEQEFKKMFINSLHIDIKEDQI